MKDNSIMSVILRTRTITTDSHSPLKVRAGNGRKGTKRHTKPHFSLLANAVQPYEFMKPAKAISLHRDLQKAINEGFNVTGFAKDRRFSFEKGVKKKETVKVLELSPIRCVQTVNAVGMLHQSAIESANNLLRNVLIFKGIGFADVERDVKLNGKTSYLLNTEVQIGERCFKLHKCTVKKTFRNDVNLMGKLETECHIFFDSASCKALKLWLETLDFLPIF